jgi:hypothetical protein
VDNNVNLWSQKQAAHPQAKTPARERQEPAHLAADLLASGSIEFSNGKPEEIEAVAQLLPRGMTVLVPVLHGKTLSSRLELMEGLHAAGFDVVPHLAARRIASRDELRGFLDGARRMGALRRVLIIGGDAEQAAGPYAARAPCWKAVCCRTTTCPKSVLPAIPRAIRYCLRRSSAAPCSPSWRRPRGSASATT